MVYRRWLEVAIEAGDPLAASTLATWYQDGRCAKHVSPSDDAFTITYTPQQHRASISTAVLTKLGFCCRVISAGFAQRSV